MDGQTWRQSTERLERPLLRVHRGIQFAEVFVEHGITHLFLKVEDHALEIDRQFFDSVDLVKAECRFFALVDDLVGSLAIEAALQIGGDGLLQRDVGWQGCRQPGNVGRRAGHHNARDRPECDHDDERGTR